MRSEQEWTPSLRVLCIGIGTGLQGAPYSFGVSALDRVHQLSVGFPILRGSRGDRETKRQYSDGRQAASGPQTMK